MRLRIIQKCFLGIFGLLIGHAGIVQGESFKVIKYTYDLPPYYFRVQQSSGIVEDLFAAIGKITKDEFQYRYLPPARAQMMFEENEMDIEPVINPEWRQHSKVPGVYTIPFAEVIDIVLFRPRKRISIRSPTDLEGEIVGTVRGFVYPKFTEVFAKGIVKRRDNLNVDLLLKQLATKRFDQIFIAKITALYWMKEIPAYRNFEVGDEIGRVEVMLRLHPSKAYALERFNKAIKNLKELGEIERIYAKYR